MENENVNDTAELSKLLEGSRKRLLETGTRSSLIHVNRKNIRSNSLNIINERSDEIYTILRIRGKRMRFKALGKDESIKGDGMVLAKPDENIDSTRFTDNFLESPLGPEAMARRILKVAKAAKIAEEEQGVNILYLALGFLQWKEATHSQKVREAPLILLPVQLERNNKTSTYDIVCREDDLSTNLSLSERLYQDFGIRLPEIEEVEGWLPSYYFSKVEKAISSKVDWNIDQNGIQLGFFSFAKLLMHHDLDPENWPNGEFENNKILDGILRSGFKHDDPLFAPEDKLDEKLSPGDLIQVVDADASQTKVIEEVRRGANMVVQGPPGTGKSQTITNIIASAAYDGKTVLFVAEKMAALNVVHQRLVKSGLQDLCLELHSRSANKKAVLHELKRTLIASQNEIEVNADTSKLIESRNELNNISSLLHTPINGIDGTPFEALSEVVSYIGKGVPAPKMALDGLERKAKEDRVNCVRSIRQFSDSYKRLVENPSNPFKGSRELFLQPTDLERLKSDVRHSLEVIKRFMKICSDAAKNYEFEVPKNLVESERLLNFRNAFIGRRKELDHWIKKLYFNGNISRLNQTVRIAKNWSFIHLENQDKFNFNNIDLSLSQLRLDIQEGVDSWFKRNFGNYNRSSKKLASLITENLPKAPKRRLKLIETLIEINRVDSEFSIDKDWLINVLGEDWRDIKTPFKEIEEAIEWIENIKKTANLIKSPDELGVAIRTSNGLERITVSDEIDKVKEHLKRPLSILKLDYQASILNEDVYFQNLSVLVEVFERILGSEGDYEAWVSYEHHRKEIINQGAAELLELIISDKIKPEDAVDEYLYACAESRWKACFAKNKDLQKLQGTNRHELCETFKKLEKNYIESTKGKILKSHYTQIPKGSVGNMGYIHGEIARKRGHKPVRTLVKNTGPTLQRIKPVFLMSPISVAQFLSPGAVKFDLLVIDEASQIKPEDAIGVIARCNQIVVVGDQKQLPPTSFFDRLLEDDENDVDDDSQPADLADMESILTLCEARGIRQRVLEWHYRSKDPSLIRVSNSEFYQDNLILPPSPLERDTNYGLSFRKVPGVYSSGNNGEGRRGTNRIEAEEISKAVSRHALENPELSLGIVTFSKTQCDMITEVLEYKRREDNVLDKFLREGKSEDVFVKNIENVQGDERDVILISVGYGPEHPNGRLMRMNFGPINREGGERRLNVLFTRARVRCITYTSFDPVDIDPLRTKGEGVRVLKRYLDYAKNGNQDHSSPTGLEADSPFETDVADVITSLGYDVDLQVGSAGFRIDIGVRNPNYKSQYILAVECDGATYHSSLWARERDRLRQEILENMGWRFHRIWSTDWFYRREDEIKRLKLTLNNLTDNIKVSVRGANNKAKPITKNDRCEEFVFDKPLKIKELTVPKYQKAEILIQTDLHPSEVSLEYVSNVVLEIVNAEGPIFINELSRRLASSFGLSRTGNKIKETTLAAVSKLTLSGAIETRDNFVATGNQFMSPPVRDRSEETGSVLKAENLSKYEVLAANALIIKESGELDIEEKIRVISRLLGYKRVGPELHQVIGNCFRGL
ncbi:DUF3320 domain-containing protein [Luteibaculum oceani]|uniref:DUF3320 domain-containing protein n=1 Tax=Luteibaculum oceani TaxID=1294296 RepID=A0A5C6UTN8_9FLAO|nr:DUF3320 domain-containing protein [Luteibaculum oceani]TXC75601.1 DUF3320 domain-containing protein [Luteibaculum oceani]